MASDTELAERVRVVLAGSAPVPPVEKKMLGGMTFMVGGNMCCGIMGEELLVRVGAAEVGCALAEPGTRPFDMGRGPSADFLLAQGSTAGRGGISAESVRRSLRRARS
jgi:hypothetical protein